MPQLIIKVDKLNKTFEVKQKMSGAKGVFRNIFAPQHKIVRAVEDISFSVEAGELLAFIGPNGAGKSTTIKMLTGILYPTSGEISVLGLSPFKNRQELAFSIGTVFGQKPQLWYHLPAIDTYNLFAKIYELKPAAYRERLGWLVESFEIKDLLKSPVRKLSLGERMRCEIVASLLHRPKVIFLDEPTIGLDVVAKQNIREMIKFLNEKEKVTIFLTSHDAGDIETLAKRTIIINDGKMIFNDSTDQLKKNYLQKKIIELVTLEPAREFVFPGSRIVERGKFNLKIELDLQIGNLSELLQYALKNFTLQDINIFESPLEEIIAHIYRAQNK